MTHGGKRKGAGRKPAPTRLIRVPLELLEKVMRMIEEFRMNGR